jgi:uncharacterized membrane protein
MKRLGNYFLQGLLLIAPLVVTGYIVFKVFQFTDGILSDYLEKYFQVKVPGLGILLIIIFLIVLGIVGQTIVARPIKKIINRILEKAPVLKLIYSSINDLFSAFVGKEKKFHRPVLVLFNEENDIWKMGFVTQNSLANLGLEDKAAVYFPHSYNFSGELYIVPVKRIKPLMIPPAEAMKFVVSGGVSDI